MNFEKKELKKLLIAIIISALIFSFTEWGEKTFELSTGILNLLRAFLISALIFSLRASFQKWYAHRIDLSTEFTMPYLKSKVEVTKYFGPLVTIFITLMSAGQFLLPLLSSFDLKVNRALRAGRKWTNPQEMEIGKIALLGIISDVFLLTIFKLLVPFNEYFFAKAVSMATAYAIFNLLPLPKLDGERIFFGNKLLYLSTVIFTITYVGLITLVSFWSALIIAVILTSIIFFWIFYKSNS